MKLNCKKIKLIVAIFTFSLFVLIPFGNVSGQELQLTKYVNPFIGTAPGKAKVGFHGKTGDVFPGADYPRGMLQWSPDTPSNLPGGYFYPDSEIKGFSLTHFSGRGCVYLQDFAFMPLIGNLNSPPSEANKFYQASFSHKNESASPGFYSVLLNNGIRVELTVTKRTGIGRFIFPKSKEISLLINAGSNARGTTPNTSITITDNNQVQGYATAKVGCGREYYTIYFSAKFKRPFKSFAVWKGVSIHDKVRSGKGAKVGAILNFNASKNNVVEVKTGISFISIKNAENNLEVENPGWDFEKVRNSTAAAWNKILNKVVVKGGTQEQKQIFYTALYHCFFQPNIFNDANDKYLGMDGKVHHLKARQHVQYENIPGWDIYRSNIALVSMLEPQQASDIMQSLINDAQQGGGGLPRWEQANHNSAGMVGDGPVIMIANAYAFGARNFNTKAALTAMNLNAGKPGTTSDGNLVRKGLKQYIRLGYVPLSASKTLEYATADFALSQFAKKLGNSSDYKLYLKRLGYWKNLYNSSTGFIQPREKDGDWVQGVIPTTTKGYSEGSATQYTWMVQFDMHGLFEKMGGNLEVVKRLDKYFTNLDERPKSEYAYMGNEPCEGNPWAYDFAGAPYETQAVVRRIQTQLFKDSPNGFPGNDDAGALSSWYVFSAIGFYPEIPGIGILVLGSPLFPKVVLHLKKGNVTIIGKNAGKGSPYVQNLTVNGKKWNRPWVRFKDISNGGKLIYKLGNKPDKMWGNKPENAPPSFNRVSK